MSLILAISMMIAAWLAISAAMLWGVLRISRRHHTHHRVDATPPAPHEQQPRPASLPH